MSNTPQTYTRTFTALLVTCVVAAFTAQPAAAQTAKKLKCTGCVKSKQIKNSGIKGADIKAGTIDGSKFKNGTIDGGKIASGAVGTEEIEDGSIGEADLGFDPATAGDIGLLMTKIDNLAHLRASGASAYVFVTSETYSGNLGGVAGADEKCQTLADAAGLPGLYKAWIADSDPATAPATRFTQAPSAYILPPGTALNASATVAQSFADLIRFDIEVPINVTEQGENASGTTWVWTNAQSDGTIGTTGSALHCDGWTDAGTILQGFAGARTLVTRSWALGFGVQCDGAFGDGHLYCFGQ